ncbi:NADP-dependent oxidoreductase domain-containing protein [Boeremia exigua]|uniref:NADP-dependent oxidoreductase domain-containing protein n=1 Tax=Boeremia exigua TaxID=749465 RepID=UPI001E8E8AC0|nr:NADP-dependent oxidoreductase domain-containing protein [Boeremia exigua]KAH6613014.1 NADP-dependent oxidoreductase domain-containing protein [Boeremia exigua]
MSFLTAPLGRNGPHVPRIGLGLMGLSIFYGATKPDSQRLALLDKAHDLGQRFWDTADMYGDNEDLLGKWFAANPNKRSDIFLATKFANKTLPDGSSAVDSTPEYARTACEKSLQRLGLPSVDLYYVHRVDLKTPIEKTMEALVELKNEGKFKYIGLSEVSSSTLRRAHAVHPITAVQIEYSPFALEAENENGTYLLATARELGVAVVCYSPLGRGLFGGALRSPDNFEQSDFRKHLPRFSQESFSKNIKLVDQLTEVADEKGVTPGQLTLAWLLAQGEDIFPIPGTTSQERLAENGHSVTINLTEDETAKVRKLVDAADVSGSRYPEAFMSLCYADTPVL